MVQSGALSFITYLIVQSYLFNQGSLVRKVLL